MTYYISRGGQQHGPYAMSDLQNMLAQGQIDPNDLAWGEGLPAWTPISQIVAPAPAPMQAPPVGPAPVPVAMAAPAPLPTASPGELRSANVLRRYKGGYQVADVIVGLGKVLKIIGIVVAFLCVLGAVMSFAATPAVEGAGIVRFLVIAYGIFIGIFSWLAFWLWGVVIAAVGQLLKATLDGAVHTSPFLSDDQRAEAMGV